MSFLYRLPLFQFDHDNPSRIALHWDSILQAIKLSSTAFYNELEGKVYKDLDHRQRIKLRKYLLRGRFRPTPFGRFAGVGTGTWEKEILINFPIQTSEVNGKSPHGFEKQLESNPDRFLSNYHLVPGIYKRHKYYHALVFDTISRSWKGCKLPVNPLFEALIKTTSKEGINFNKFQQLLSTQLATPPTAQAKLLWEQVLDSGFLAPEYLFDNKQSGVDMVVKNRLKLPEGIREQLMEFINSAGSIFSKEESSYIRDFKNFFTTQFDDRYVCLSDLLSHTEFLAGQFLQPEKAGMDEDITPTILGNHERKSIDLKKFFAKKELQQEIHDVQILFRLDALGNPIIENMVCNRPFVYTGRFNRDPNIKDLSQQIKKSVYTDAETLYANVQLLEAAPIQHICNVENVFDYEITPFKSKTPKQLGFDELYLGIWENRIQLIHKYTGKQVIPVIMHPLNGEQITHPILRLLWEIAHHDRYRFLPYKHNILSQSPYCPQLKWGQLCLQSRKWKLNRDTLATPKELRQKLEDLEIPFHILAGHTDRELLLNPNNPDDLKILWQELQRDQTLTLSDPNWFPAGLFRAADSTAAYPQFVFQHSRPQLVKRSKLSFNPITHTHKNCLCFTLTINPTEIPEVLERLLHQMEEPQVSSLTPVWYYLLYGKNGATEIRLRLLDIAPIDKRTLLASFSEFFLQEDLNWKTASYFPETAKYGNSGLETSHLLFHLESIFLATKFQGILYLNYPPKYKEDLVVHLWRIIFFQSPYLSRVFSHLKEDVKSMPWDEVKTFKSCFEYASTFETLGFESEKYLELISSHEYFHSKEDSAIHLMSNHLHMMINRFFPLETQDYERRIRYRLYREIGKQVYAFQQPIQTLGNRILRKSPF
ncbi:lantibiotic dehydratase [Algoriphagus sp. AGSA1]|uniref:lantibiotic dehydratase n=1 Tax=unclassified Algoriphagus TaxID=2641541 RepID=UPI001781E415|nr:MULTISPECIES: lantibiotic dehydratase [unclassified Algoriphagus]MCE7057591.1 lantibiotic dehydratase [Algoriphagus sp. AGSA1]